MNTKTGFVQQNNAPANPLGQSSPARTQFLKILKNQKNEIAKALPSVMTPERFTRIATTALSNNPTLCECTPISFVGALMQAAQLGVEPNTPLGQAYLIPYENRKAGTKEVQFQLGYKGLIDLAYRSGAVTDISAEAVHQNDYFEYELGYNKKLVHRPALTDRGPAIFYYAVYHTKDGGGDFKVMSVADINAHAAKTSQAYKSNYSPWHKYPEEMAKKTVIKALLKYAPLKTEFVRGVMTDETVKSHIDADMMDVQDDITTLDNETGEQVSPNENPKAAPDNAPGATDPSLFNEGAR